MTEDRGAIAATPDDSHVTRAWQKYFRAEAMKEVRKGLCKQQKELKAQSQKQKQQIQKDMENLRKQLLQMKAEWI